VNTEEDMTDEWGETWSEDDRVGLGPAPTVLPNDPRTPLTGRQAVIVAAIHGLSAARGVPPTRREVAYAAGVRSVNGIQGHVQALARKGYLRRPGGHTTRELVLLPPPGKEVGWTTSSGSKR
jgi:hypothetical protein